ncbi:MAG: outer membrane beta-barrel protein [Caulobacter sp.]|nr:outer membrane beta-barrel protein [Caulobacter sp.]
MLKITLLAAALAATAAPALAQDVGGFYLGGELGYGKPKNDLTYTPKTGSSSSGSTDKTGLSYGAFAGYGAVLSGGLYLGAEGSLAGGGGGKSSRNLGAAKVTIDPKFRYGAAARLGMALGDSGLVYGKVGLERRKLDTSIIGAKKSLTQQGVAYGVGYEQKLTETFGLRGELTRVNYGDKTASFSSGEKVKVDSKDTRLTIGGVVHF